MSGHTASMEDETSIERAKKRLPDPAEEAHPREAQLALDLAEAYLAGANPTQLWAQYCATLGREES